MACSSAPSAAPAKATWTLSGTYVLDAGPTSALPYVALDFESDGTFSATPSQCQDVSCIETGTFVLSADGDSLTLDYADGTFTTLPTALESLEPADGGATVTASSVQNASIADLTTGGGALVIPGQSLVAVAVKLYIAHESASLAASCGGATASPASPTIAQGEFCYFVRKNSAMGFGHLGCGYNNGNGFTYGGIEDISAQVAIASINGANDGWYVNGTRSSMLAQMQDGVTPCGYPWTLTGYDGYECQPVANANVKAAAALIDGFPSRGYALLGNSCLSACEQLYTAYSGQQPPSGAIPDLFYLAVRDSSWTCSSWNPSGAEECSPPQPYTGP